MRKSIWKRALSLVLSLAMLLTLVPAFNVLPEAKAAEDRVIEDQTDANGNKVNYITLPITIRDFAADGMLFEWNEVDTDKGTETVVTETDGLTHTSYEVDYNPYYWDRNSTGTATGSTEGYKGIRVYSKDWPVYDEEYDNTETNGAWWYVLILNSKGDIIKVLDMESEKEDVDTVIAATTGAAYSVWAWADSSNAEASAPLKEIYADYAAALAKYNNDEEKAVAALAKHRFTLTGVTGSGNAITGTLSRGRYYKNESLKQVPKETHEDGYETNPYKTDARGVYLFDGNAVAGYLGDGTLSSLDAYNSAWHTVVMNSSNQVVAVVPKMPQGDDVDEDKYKKSLALANYVTSDYKILMVWDTDENADYRDLFTCITDETKSEYTITGTATSFDTSVLSVTRTRTFVEADTKAFGLLATNENDYLDVLDPDAETNAIFGSEFISQGGWNSSTEPEVLEAGLYSVDNRTTPYATQDVYGATIRTNLVDKGLDKNGNPLYTP